MSDLEALGEANATLASTPEKSARRVVRDPATRGLLLLAIVYGIGLGRSVLLPLVIAIFLTFLLRPLARGLARIGVPSTVAATLLIVLLIGVVAQGAYLLADPIAEWMGDFPDKVKEVERRFRPFQEQVEGVTEAAAKVEALADVPSPSTGKTVEVIEGKTRLAPVLLSGTGALFATLLLILTLTFFLLASGEAFLDRLVKFLPLGDDRGSVEVLADIERQASRYVLSITLINLALGVLVGLGLYALGLPNPVLWGTMAFVLNFVPYLGAMVGTILVGIAALLAFDNLGSIVGCVAVYLVLTFLEGTVVTPMILGGRLALNPLVVFLALLFWGALWGIPGALIAVPMLAVLKLICEEIPTLTGISELLSARSANP